MMCELQETLTLAKFICLIVINGGGILSTCFSVFFLSVNKNIDSSLRKILISFQGGGVIGNCVLLHSTISDVCNGTSSSFRWISSCMLLTLTHLVLMMLVEHSILSSSVHKPLPSYSGLICVYWLTSSIIVGIWNATTTLVEEEKVVALLFSLCTLVIIVAMCAMFVVVR